MRRITDVEDDALDSSDVDYDLSDDSPTEENLALDADLIIGTGLDAGAKMDIAEDFGFAETADIHTDLPDWASTLFFSMLHTSEEFKNQRIFEIRISCQGTILRFELRPALAVGSAFGV